MTLLTFSKVALILALVQCAVLALPRASAALRHQIIATAMIAALVIPILDGRLPAWKALPSPSESALAAAFDPGRTGGQPAPVVAEAKLPDPVSPAPLVTFSASQAMLSVWLSGVAAFLVLLLVRCASMQLAVRATRRTDDRRWCALLTEQSSQYGLGRPVQLRLRRAGTMPAVWGWRCPVVLLPEDCLEWSDEQCRDVLAHELAHLLRFDVPMRVLSGVACALHWFNPLAWMLQRRMRRECEHACDDLALSQGRPAAGYAGHLLSMAASHGNHESFAPLMAARSELEDRIMAILDRQSNRRAPTARTGYSLAGLAAAILVPLCSLSWAQAPDLSSAGPGAWNAQSDSARFASYFQNSGVDATDVEALIVGLGADEALVRAASAWALGRTNDPRAVDPLISAGYDSAAITRQWAIRALEQWQTPPVASMLIDRLQDDDAEVRQWAARTMRGHDPRVTMLPLIGALGDADSEVREWAARSLAEIDDPQVRFALADRSLVETDDDVREWLVRSLGQGGESQSFEALLASLGSRSADVREWAVRGLGGTTDARAVDALIGMLADGNAEVREWSARGLAVCGNVRAAGALKALEADPDGDVREWAGRALAAIDC